MIDKTQWRLTYDSFLSGEMVVEMFDSDEAADVAAQKLHEEGRTGIVLTMIRRQSWAFDKAKRSNWRVLDID
jgi:hypothetical protein